MTIAAGVMVALLPGMQAKGDPPILGIAAFSLFMALINASIKPVVHVLALPLSILSLGFVALVRRRGHQRILVVRAWLTDHVHRVVDRRRRARRVKARRRACRGLAPVWADHAGDAAERKSTIVCFCRRSHPPQCRQKSMSYAQHATVE